MALLISNRARSMRPVEDEHCSNHHRVYRLGDILYQRFYDFETSVQVICDSLLRHA